MIIPRNMLNPPLQPVVFWLVGICYAVLYNVINPLPLGFVRQLHDVHLEFCRRIAILIFHGIQKRTVFLLSRLRWRCQFRGACFVC